MAICRAVTSTRLRDVPHRSSMDTPKYVAVAFMIAAAVISGSAASGIRSRRTISASVRSTCDLFRLANAATRISAPSSSRMLRSMWVAMYSSTSPGTGSRSVAAFFDRIAILVSRSGGVTSVIRPHSNRLRSRSSSAESCLGERSEEMTICFSVSCSTLKVWKNSSWVRSLFSRNWMSSTRSTSVSR